MRHQNKGGNGLAGEQGDLAQQLEEFMRSLNKNGLQAPPSLGEAGKKMGEARQSLEQQDREQALSEQGEALNQLREGAQNMARQNKIESTTINTPIISHGQGSKNKPLPDGESEMAKSKSCIPVVVKSSSRSRRTCFCSTVKPESCACNFWN